ncbi:hypothetical protein OH818_19720 [Jiella pelagia]|uniref:Uncharacterized protein n=1 Tax=Jiella pelagia TaxID=2986949 RepID=A0ABY7BV53_9HYPH|nr:hypothetical protein [Jiella pelagia]WAP67687.1 hypothetical protein OH818_19720 [Jiella pelagia]
MLTVLLPLVLRDRRQQVLDHDRVGVFPELDGRRFESAACFQDHGAQLQMGVEPAREPRHVVNNDDSLLAFALHDKAQHSRHAGALSLRARDIVGEDMKDLMALHARILTAAGLLAAQAIADRGLLDAGHPAVNDGKAVIGNGHGGSPCEHKAGVYRVSGL